MSQQHPARRGLAALAWVLIPLALTSIANFSNRAGAQTALPTVGWSQAASLPPEFVTRWDFSYAYFPPLDEVVVFGGAPKLSAEPWFNDTWVYRDGAWSAGPAAPGGLTPRGGAAMAYDPDIQKLVLFGGAGSSWPPLGDTWLFDGTSWSPGPAAPAELGGRSGAQMAYLPDIGKVVLFGGSGITPFNDTWFFDGTQWSPGPATPAEVAPRVYFGTTYVPPQHALFITGGDGATDGWYFDGATWVPGPNTDALGLRERVRMAWDPKLSSVMLYSGLGPGSPIQTMWMLQGSTWTRLLDDPANDGWPPARVDGAVLWNPAQDSTMVFGGIASGDVGTTGLSDAWFFRDVAPTVASASISPTDPLETQAITLTKGDTVDGYGPDTFEYEWYVAGQKVPGATTTKLDPGNFHSGDEVYARVRVTDELGLTGDWVVSNTVTVGNRAPSIGSVGLNPAAAYVTSTLTAVPQNVFDPDGDLMVTHYVWTIDGVDLAGNDDPHLQPNEFTAGDVISVRAYVVDDRGAYSNTVTSPTRTIKWNLTAVNPVKPGNSLNISGAGYGPLERVEFKLDSPTAAVLASTTTDSKGKFTGAAVKFPTPLGGGMHMLYGIGQTSGTPGRGPITVIPSIKIAPTALAAGASTLLTGVGFVPGETVTASFPLGSPWTQTSDPNGSVSISMVSPELPAPGGSVTASAPSSSATASYTVVATFVSPALGVPLASTPITLTGYGALETVNAKFDGVASGQSFTTDASGSLRANLLMPSTFGKHTLTMTGVLSKVTKTNNVNLPATMTIAPTSGPVGTVVTIDSGPGWIPASRIKLMWGTTTVQYLVADSAGGVHTPYTIPQHAPGTVSIKLNSPDLKVTAMAPFTVTPAGSNQQAMYGRRRLA